MLIDGFSAKISDITDEGAYPELRKALAELPDGKSLWLDATEGQIGCIRQVLFKTFGKGAYKTKRDSEGGLVIWKAAK